MNGTLKFAATASLLAAVFASAALAQTAPHGVVPSPLLAVDQNRETVIARIVDSWGAPLERSAAGLSQAQLREMLQGLRSDYLIAASAAGTLDGLRAVLSSAIESSPMKDVRMQKALGDANADLVYTPVTPCRLFDTRPSQGGGGILTSGGPRTYGATASVPQQGGPGNCNASAGAVVALILIGTVTPSGNGLLQGGPQGTANFPNALILFQPGDQYGTAVAMPLNAANGQFTVVSQFASTDLYGDLLGYFRPATGFVASITGGTGITISGNTTPTINLAATQLLPAVQCAAGQYATWNGAAWACHSPPTFQSFSGFVGGIPPGEAVFTFHGGTGVVVIPAGGGRLTGAATAALGSGNATLSLIQADLCYQVTGGAVTEFTPSGYVALALATAATQRDAVTVTGTAGGLAAGSYTVGLCTRSASMGFNNNDIVTGWVMMTPN